MVRLNPLLRQNYSIFMRKISINYQIIRYNFQMKTPFVNPLARNLGSAPASIVYSTSFTWASPYGTHKEPGCTAHMGAHMGPIWVPYRLLAGSMHLTGAVSRSQSPYIYTAQYTCTYKLEYVQKKDCYMGNPRLPIYM